MPTPLNVYETDLSRYTGAGYGILTAEVSGLEVGEVIAVTDEGADVIAAEVIEIHEGAARATIRAQWETVLEKA